jgi:hypothetical protein
MEDDNGCYGCGGRSVNHRPSYDHAAPALVDRRVTAEALP